MHGINNVKNCKICNNCALDLAEDPPTSFSDSLIFLCNFTRRTTSSSSPYFKAGTAVAQWLRCCATNRKVAGSIPAGVSGFFFDIKSFRLQYGPGVNSASNINEYQEYFLEVKTAGA